ncbi:MAG: hypothetical protein Q4F72_06970 [Desulfovibrionaceae bacterium]|nr:hypothetical protein [Desulfovibrionaceae bacterium]
MLAERKVRMRLDPEHPVFRTHFPGMPRMPGSLVVQGFLDLLAEAGIPPANLVLRRFRFRRFLTPGDYVYEIEPCGERRAVCRVRDGNAVACEGVAEWPE